MATSGTYAFEPKVAEFVDEAFERCGIDPAKLTFRHLRSARRSLGLMFSDWNNVGVKLWAVDEQTQLVTDGDPTYDTASGTITILEMFVRRSGVDTPVYPMSRSEYAAIANKIDEGLPTKYFLDRQRALPTYTLWNVPENNTDVIHYWRMRRLQDVGNPSATLDVGSNWFEAVAAGLAARLSVKFAPSRVSMLGAMDGPAFQRAYGNERERGDTHMSIGGR